MKIIISGDIRKMMICESLIASLRREGIYYYDFIHHLDRNYARYLDKNHTNHLLWMATSDVLESVCE